MIDKSTNLMSLIVEVLGQTSKSMHVDEIADELIVKYPNIKDSKESLSNKISSFLSSDIRRKGRNSGFSKPKNKRGGGKRGFYRLKAKKIKPDDNLIIAEQPKLNSIYTGKAGEHAVLSELLFFGFNASYMAVDDGIDVVATKDNKYFHIQVKTSNKSTNGIFSFTLNQKSYDAKDASSTFYILVMRDFYDGSYKNNYIIFPNNEIRRLVENTIVKRSEKMSLRVEKDRFGKYMFNNLENISWSINRFDTIS